MTVTGAVKTRAGFAVMLALVCATPGVAHSQEAGTSGEGDAGASGRADVLAAVEQIFEGMRTANPDMVRDVFASDARFAVLDASDGVGVGVESVDAWIEALGGSEGRWDERIYDVEVRVDGEMASVWAPYTFYLDGAVRHCGINSIEMLRDAVGWKVTQVSDTRRTDGCPDPLEEGGP